MSRNTIRGILLGIIMLTIPCYIIGIIAWAVPGDNTALPDGGSGATASPTWTPIDPDNVTERPTDIFGAPITPDFLFTQTPRATASATPFQFQQPTSLPPPTDIVFTVAPVATNTPFPTSTPFPTNTPAATPTPTATEFILQPPTDTPAP